MQQLQSTLRRQLGLSVRPFSIVLMGLLGLTSLAACYGGGSARANYYNSRAIESQAREGDGGVVIISDRSDDLRQALLRAKRVQLAEISGDK